MKDYARAEHGSSIVMTSCMDDRYPPANVLDGKDNTFWITTGMFPQEFVIALAKPIQVEKITFLSQSVKKLAVETCAAENAQSFEKVFEVELANREGRLQTEVQKVNIKAKFLKFTLLSGWAEFSTVNRISVLGQSLDGEDDGDE